MLRLGFCANGDGSGTSRSQVRWSGHLLLMMCFTTPPSSAKSSSKKELSFLLHTFLGADRSGLLPACKWCTQRSVGVVEIPFCHERNAHDVEGEHYSTPQTGAESSFSSFFHFRECEVSVVHRKTLSQSRLPCTKATMLCNGLSVSQVDLRGRPKPSWVVAGSARWNEVRQAMQKKEQEKGGDHLSHALLQ